MTLDAWRLEELSLNSSAPPGQLLYDGWVLRLAPGKAKRARSINPVYPSAVPMAEKIAYCEQLYASVGLPAIFRITPFTQPPGLEMELEQRGYGRFDVTAVESATLQPERFDGATVEGLPLEEWVAIVGALRRSSREQCAGHLARLQGCPLAKLPAVLKVEGRVVATGLTIIEGTAAGIFDIITDETQRRAGHARRLVAGLLAHAWSRGAREAYLQVDQANTPARNLYRQFGFTERYLYWYRGRPGEQN
jgi:N-acetylglutamate synthase